jgi:SAM-dependent methyltransferase
VRPSVGGPGRAERHDTEGEATSDNSPVAVDRLFADPALTALYDAMCRGRPDFAFYLPLVASADAVLDVGCGTGELLRRARAAGHTGRLCGLDPAPAMLDHACPCTDVDWVVGDLRSVDWDHDFSLVVMTGHAFQVLVTDDELRVGLVAIRRALASDGRFVFETRNPHAREWESWAAHPSSAVVADDATVVHRRVTVDAVRGDLVRFTQTYTSPHWATPRASTSTLRFLDAASLRERLAAAGLVVHAQFGDWDRTPLHDSSPEIITIAARA